MTFRSGTETRRNPVKQSGMGTKSPCSAGCARCRSWSPHRPAAAQRMTGMPAPASCAHWLWRCCSAPVSPRQRTRQRQPRSRRPSCRLRAPRMPSRAPRRVCEPGAQTAGGMASATRPVARSRAGAMPPRPQGRPAAPPPTRRQRVRAMRPSAPAQPAIEAAQLVVAGAERSAVDRLTKGTRDEEPEPGLRTEFVHGSSCARTIRPADVGTSKWCRTRVSTCSPARQRLSKRNCTRSRGESNKPIGSAAVLDNVHQLKRKFP